MLKVLIVEDDLMLADASEEILVGSGYEVSGIARTVADAVALARHSRPDLVILDLRLADGGLGTEVAAQLSQLGRPGILYVTGNMSQVTLTDGDACLAKPYRAVDLLRGLKIVAGIVARARRSRHFRKGSGSCPRQPHPRRSSMTENAIQVRKLLRQQAAIAHFGSFALRENDVLKVLTEAARVCAECLSVPYSKVCRYREKEKRSSDRSRTWLARGLIGNVVSRADVTSPQGRAFITGEPSICNDLRDDNDFKLPSFYAEHGIVSTIDVIIKGATTSPTACWRSTTTNSMITTSTTSTSSRASPMFLRRLSQHLYAPASCKAPSSG